MANLMRRDPSLSLPTFQSLQREMNRMFDDFFEDASRGTRAWGPPVEIFETGDELNLVAELPGLDKEEVDLSYENGLLTISGERKRPEDQKDRTYHRTERWYGKFERSFQIPNIYDGEKIRAGLKDGNLTVSMPKKKDARPRHIPVSVT